MTVPWLLIAFSTFSVWAAGLLGVQSVYALRGLGEKAQRPAAISALALLLAGICCLMGYFGHIERVFNAFKHLRSGLTQELIGVVVLLIIVVALLIVLRREGKAPKWLLAVSVVAAVAFAIIVGAASVNTFHRTWSAIPWVLFVFGAAAILGCASFAVIDALQKEPAEVDGFARVCPLGVAAGYAVLSLVGLFYAESGSSAAASTISLYDPTHPMGALASSAQSLFSGGLLSVSVIGVIAIGVVCTVAAMLVGYKQKTFKIWGAIALVCALVGVVCLQVLFFSIGSGGVSIN